MRVTFLTGEYPPLQGGIADHTACLAQHLAALDVQPSILIQQGWQTLAGQAAPESAPVHALVPGWGWRSWPAITDFARRHRPDVLHIQYQAAAFDLAGWINWLPWYLKQRRVTPRIVTTFHDLRVPYLFPKAGPLRRQAVLALARHSDAVVCTNRADLAELQRVLPRSNGRAALIPLGSNVEPQPPAGFDRAIWRHLYQAGPQTLLLAYFGFLNESKGGEELVEALALVRQQQVDARLLFIGGDVGHADPTNVTYARRVRELIERHGLADVVYHTGYIGPAEVSANLLAADVVVMPYRDGVSFRRTTLIAALRHGCPVVSTYPAGRDLIPEVRAGENMLLAPPRDPAALARLIGDMARNPGQRQALARGSLELGALFDWPKIAEATAALYRAVLPA